MVREREGRVKMIPRFFFFFLFRSLNRWPKKLTEKEITGRAILIEGGKDYKHAHAYKFVEILSRDERISSGEGSELRWRFERDQPEGDMDEFFEDYPNSYWDNPNRMHI